MLVPRSSPSEVVLAPLGFQPLTDAALARRLWRAVSADSKQGVFIPRRSWGPICSTLNAACARALFRTSRHSGRPRSASAFSAQCSPRRQPPVAQQRLPDDRTSLRRAVRKTRSTCFAPGFRCRSASPRRHTRRRSGRAIVVGRLRSRCDAMWRQRRATHAGRDERQGRGDRATRANWARRGHIGAVSRRWQSSATPCAPRAHGDNATCSPREHLLDGARPWVHGSQLGLACDRVSTAAARSPRTTISSISVEICSPIICMMVWRRAPRSMPVYSAAKWRCRPKKCCAHTHVSTLSDSFGRL
jgi:hypothetical protein